MLPACFWKSTIGSLKDSIRWIYAKQTRCSIQRKVTAARIYQNVTGHLRQVYDFPELPRLSFSRTMDPDSFDPGIRLRRFGNLNFVSNSPAVAVVIDSRRISSEPFICKSSTPFFLRCCSRWVGPDTCSHM